MPRILLLLPLLLISICSCTRKAPQQTATIIQNVTLIDGSGAEARSGVDIVIQADTIAAILPHASQNLSDNAQRVNMSGKTIIPMLINTHGHLGLLKGNEISPVNYTRENIIHQLEKYESFGVSTVLSLGSDREIIFALRDSSQQGKLPGALLFTAGYGFGTPGGVPPVHAGFDKVLRPQNPEEAVNAMRQLATLKPDFVKIWIDDAGGTLPRMPAEFYKAIITEAHAQGIRVAAHVFYLEDARKLVAAGIDVLAHSIRDQEIDDALLQEMKNRNVVYIPTLSLDEYNFVYLQQPEWLDDPFFHASLEPGVLEMLTNESYLDKLRNDPDRQRKVENFQTGLRNLQKIYNAGITVCMGTDSGAQPVRAQGFSEHYELQLMTRAGLTPLQAITCATRNGARLLNLTDQGILQTGKKANFIILDGNPLDNMMHTRRIRSVWKNGVQVGNGPIHVE